MGYAGGLVGSSKSRRRATVDGEAEAEGREDPSKSTSGIYPASQYPLRAPTTFLVAGLSTIIPSLSMFRETWHTVSIPDPRSLRAPPSPNIGAATKPPLAIKLLKDQP